MVPVHTWRGTVGGFHAADLLSDAVGCSVWVAEPIGPAIVLGSSQRDEAIDRGRAVERGMAVVRRRSGGGAVLVDPTSMVWFDVVVPVGDHRGLPLGDVTASMVALGDRVARALAALGVDDVEVYHGRLERTPASALVCFAGLGPGEVVRRRAGAVAKLVGISQRRTRAGARFQCAVHTRWDPAATLAVLSPAVPVAATALPPVATLANDVATALPAALARAL